MIVTEILLAQNRQRILDWISPDYHTAFHSNTLNKVEDIEKPGKWFINGSTFQEWRDNKTSSILWIKGDSKFLGKTRLNLFVSKHQTQLVQVKQSSCKYSFQ